MSLLNDAQIMDRTLRYVDIFLDFALSKIYSFRPMKKIMVVVVCFAICILKANAETTYSALQNVANFGWLNQRDSQIVEATGRNGCNPTSWVNLMVKLQNQYSDIFHTDLVGATYADWTQSAITLAGSSYLNTTPTSGTDSGRIVSGMGGYFQSKGFSGFSVAQVMYPRWDQLYEASRTNATVQLLLLPASGSNATIGHAVSLGGFNWINTNDPANAPSQSDNARLSFVDPQDPWHGLDTSSGVFGAGFADAHVWAEYNGVNQYSMIHYANNDYEIHSAYVVVPGPTIFHCLISGMLSFFGFSFRRRLA